MDTFLTTVGRFDLSWSEFVPTVVVLVDLVFAVVVDTGTDDDVGVEIDDDATGVTFVGFDFLVVFLTLGVGLLLLIEGEALELTFLILEDLRFLPTFGSGDTLAGFFNLEPDVVSEDPVDVNLCLELILEVGTE